MIRIVNTLKLKKFQSIFEKLNSHFYHLGHCQNHGEKCGRKSYFKISYPSSRPCCEGSVCVRKPGGIKKCVKGIFSNLIRSF